MPKLSKTPPLKHDVLNIDNHNWVLGSDNERLLASEYDSEHSIYGY
jgi:hypothetical protein